MVLQLQKHYIEYQTTPETTYLLTPKLSNVTSAADLGFLRGSCAAFTESIGVGVPFWVWFLILVSFCLFSLLGTTGNVLIFGAVALEKSLQNVSSAFILNLASADLVVSSYIIPLAIVNFLHGGRNPFGSFTCQLTGYLGQVCCTVSTFSLALIALNRFYFIVRFHEYSTMFSRGRTICMLASTWVLALCIALPNLTGWGHFRFDRKTFICSYDRTHRLLSSPTPLLEKKTQNASCPS